MVLGGLLVEELNRSHFVSLRSDDLSDTIDLKQVSVDLLLKNVDLALDIIDLEGLESKGGKSLSPSEVGAVNELVLLGLARELVESVQVSLDVFNAQRAGVSLGKLELELLVVLEVELNIDVVGIRHITEQSDQGLEGLGDESRGFVLEENVQLFHGLLGDLIGNIGESNDGLVETLHFLALLLLLFLNLQSDFIVMSSKFLDFRIVD